MEKDEKESYLHNEAKQLLIKWLRELSKKVGPDNYCDWCGLKWRINRGPLFYGIYGEYPLEENQKCVWDERGWDNFEYPDYEWMKEHPNFNFKIPDIVITHKGAISHIIEITHKNPLTEEKIKFYKSLPVFVGEIWEIPAEWIMGQIKEPKKIPLKFRKY